MNSPSNILAEIRERSLKMDVTKQEGCNFDGDLDMSAQGMPPRETAGNFINYGSESGQQVHGAGESMSEHRGDSNEDEGSSETGMFAGMTGDTDVDGSAQASSQRSPSLDERDGGNSSSHVFCYQGKGEGAQANESFYPAADRDQQPSNAAEENCCCVECGVTFANINLLLKHVQRHEAEQYGADDVYQGMGEESPENAGETDDKVSSLDNDASGVEERSDVTCMECGEAFDDVNSLLRHVEDAHETQLREKCDLQQSPNGFECPVCRQTFSKKGPMLDHLKRHNSRGAMSSTASRPKHTATAGLSPPGGPKADFNVYTRGRRRRDKSGNAVSNKPAHLCLICGDVFRQLTSLDSHYQAHRGAQQQALNHKCSLCGKVFSKIANLNIHMRLHNQDRPYECALCRKRFTQSSHLRQHELIHTQVRPFSCRFCPKMFRQSSHLHMHERIHTGLRPYKCQLCDKAFMQSSHLRIHERTHSRVRPYNCRFCNATFIQSAHMRLHEKRHLNEANGTNSAPTGPPHHSPMQTPDVAMNSVQHGVPPTDLGASQAQITA